MQQSHRKYQTLFFIILLIISNITWGCHHKIENIAPIKIQNPNTVKLKIRKLNLIDTTAQNILLIGDSQAYFFMKGFKRYTSETGHILHTISWVSATIETFAQTDTLPYYLKTIKPTYVIITLGTNQLQFKNKAKIIKNINTIKEDLKDFKTIWVGPLKRKRNLGLNAIFDSVLTKRSFYNSSKLQIARKASDSAHPSSSGSRMWADSVANWIMYKSKYPVKLELNKTGKYKFTKTILKPYQAAVN